MKSYESSAKTVEEAISAGLQALGASISEVNIEIINEGSKGLFGLFGSRLAKVRLTMKDNDDDLLDVLNIGKEAKKPEAAQAKVVNEVPTKSVVTAKQAPVQAKPAVPAKPVTPTSPVKPAAVPEAKKPQPVEAAATSAKPAAVQRVAPVARKAPVAPKQPVKPKAVQRIAKPNAAAKAISAASDDVKPVVSEKIPTVSLDKPEITMIPDDMVQADSPAGKAQAFVKQLTHLMGVEVEVAVGTDPEGNVFVKMTGDTLGILIGRRGETLDALQYLTSLQVNHGKDDYTRVTLDTENYRAKREDTLIRLANRMANRAVKTGRRVNLEPMNPYERRIIHAALQQNNAVDTFSEGDEPNRHVVIVLKKQKQQ